MAVVIDACVMYPTVMRDLVLGLAATGLFEPLWSERILEEWVRAAARNGEQDEAIARGDIALCRARWPEALIAADEATEQMLHLPDRSDRHVLATAILAGAALIVTMNLKDFPKRALAAHGVSAVHPDEFLVSFARSNPVAVSTVADRVRSKAESLSGQRWPLRKLMKKARLPRFGKALERLAGA